MRSQDETNISEPIPDARFKNGKVRTLTEDDTDTNYIK